MFTGEIAAGNTGLDIQSPDMTLIHFESGFFLLGTAQTQYTRTRLLADAAAGTLPLTGMTIRQSSNTVGAVIFELLPYLVKIQMNFWNHQGSTFFDVFIHIPDTLPQTTGLCQYDATCPVTASQNPLGIWYPNNVFMVDDIDYSVGVLGMVPLDTPVITQAIIDTACNPLKSVSQFYYDACIYDVPGAKNPNIANVIIASLNTIVSILQEQGVLQNFTALLNVTAGTFNGVPINLVVPGFPTIGTDDIGNPTLGQGFSTAPNLMILLALLSFLFFRR
jgi:hypothetical protein